ncbi:MAG: ABC transporter ATP-binding protein [Deltaproteobacteria bacterium]|nr:ABC transporter ATP-binding protein [Deltaproteobacteria bacterium]
MGIPAIEIKDLWFAYDRIPVLKEVSFTLEQGDFMAIIGPNGGGKTTLLKLMLGLLEPQKGTIRILGKKPRDARKKLGYVPQSTDINLTFPLSVFELALMGRLSRSRFGRRYSHEDKEKVAALLKKVGMWDYRFWPVGNLSGGQRQRIFIARALAVEPAILFLDEPTASVDREFEIGLYELLEELNRKVTVVVITHDVGVVSRHVKSVACVNHTLMFHEDGKITKDMIDMAYKCPVDLIAHGLPHRVLPEHEGE